MRFLVAVAVVFLSFLQVKGFGVNKIVSLDVLCDTAGVHVAPGSVIPLNMYVRLRDGRRLEYKKWNKMTSIVQGGQISNGALYIDSDPSYIFNYQLIITISLRARPNISFIDTLFLDYKGHTNADFSGKDAKNRFMLFGKGSQGSECCPDGGKGLSGKDGRRGDNGQTIKVYVELDLQNDRIKELVKITLINNSGDSFRYMFDPEFGSIKISANGGDGGDGSSGGNGGCGKDQSESNYAGNGGSGGNGGNGGLGGNGGDIYVFYTSDCLKYIESNQISFSNDFGRKGDPGAGGSGGRGGSSNSPSCNGRRGNDGHSGLEGSNGQKGTVFFEDQTKINFDW